MDAFVVDNHHDEKILKEIGRRVGQVRVTLPLPSPRERRRSQNRPIQGSRVVSCFTSPPPM